MSSPFLHPYVAPRYLLEGDKALVRYPTPEKPRQGAWATAVCVAGNHARMVNERLNIDRWERLEDLFVPIGSERAPL